MNFTYALDLFVASLTVIIITAATWRRRDVPGGGALTILSAAMAVWTTAYAFYWLAPDPDSGRIYGNLMFMGVVCVPPAFLAFSLYYTNRARILSNRYIAWLAVMPVLTVILVWTDPLHGWFYGDAITGYLYPGAGWWFWTNLIYSYLVILFAFAFLMQAWIATIRPLRAQLGILLVGALVPIGINLGMFFGFEPLPGLDLTPFGFVFTCVCIALALSRYHLLDLVPIARSVIIDQMTDGFMVLDTQNRVVDVNQTALKMLDRESEQVVGMQADEVFKNYPTVFNHFRDTMVMQQEICVDVDPPVYLDVRITSFHDLKGKTSGRVIIARDVTARKRVEQAEREQRLLAEALRDSATALNQSRSFEDVLDRILENVGRVVPFNLATILLADDDQTAHLARAHGFREHGLEDHLKQVTFSYQDLPNLKQMVETGESVLASDTSQFPGWKSLKGLEVLRSYVGSPIRIRDFVVGFLNLDSFTSGFYTREHAERLQVFADQAAIAIENARLLEDAQLRANELSTLLDIGLATTSGLEMDRLLQALLEKCKRVLPVEAFYVATYNNETGMVEYPLFYDQGEITNLPGHSLSQSPGLTGHVILSRQVLHITDALSEEATRRFNIVHIGGDPTRSYVGVPLLVGERVVGVISMQSSQPDAYNPAQIQLLETIATQAAGAIENARLFAEVRSHAEEMTALFDIGLAITSGLDMDQILRALLDKCRQVLPVEAFYTAILDAKTGLIHHPLAYDLGEFPQIPTRDIHESPGLSGHIINTRQTLYIPDMLAPDAIQTYQIFRTSGNPTRAFVGVPMIVGERIVGVISMQSYQPNAYDRDQIRLLETIATQAAVAIENSRLYAEAQQEISERERAEVRYRALFDQSHDAVFIIGFDGRHLDVNQRATEMLGYSVDELLALTVKDISAEPDASGQVFERLVAGETVPLYERKFRKKSGEDVVVEINAELVRDVNGTPLHIQSVVRDISHHKQSEHTLQVMNDQLRVQLSEIYVLQARLREQAIRDPLTGLFNRRYLEETLEREFSLANRQGSPVCLVMMDIDGFKGFNDTYGHDAGDFLLRNLGSLLQKEVRRSDISCRYGGEEFLIVMPGVKADKGRERAERLRRIFGSGKFKHMGVKLNATLSLGVAVYPDNGSTWEEVLHAADRAMYAAKAAGKNRARSAGN